jgi:putative ABC transport system ATP-binding protein
MLKKRVIMISLEKLNKIYKLGKVKVHALKNIDLKIEKGSFTSIMGVSGSGKSTLMNILGCLDTANSGKYYLEDTDITLLNQNKLAEIRSSKIGFIFQTFNLLPNLNIYQNIELPVFYQNKIMSKEKRHHKVLTLLESVGLNERVNHKPSEISGGQKQRVAIARSLINDPHILLADEPTGNLDSKSGAEILNIFKKMHNKGKTIILVTHDENIAKIAERMIVFKDGRIISDKTN